MMAENSNNLSNNGMETKWIETECEFCNGEGYDEDSLQVIEGVNGIRFNRTNHCENCNGSGVILELVTKQQEQ